MGFTPSQSTISDIYEEDSWVYFLEYALSPGFGGSQDINFKVFAI